MLDEVLAWGVIAVVIPVLLGVGVTVVNTRESDDLYIAKSCFVLAGLVGVVKLSQAAVRDGNWNTYPLFVAGIVGCLWFCLEASNYVDRRRKAKATRFLVQRSTSIMFLSHDDATPTFWMHKDYAVLPHALCSIDVIVLLRIVNAQATPAMVAGYRVDMQVNQSLWVTLLNMGTGTIYNVGKSLLDNKGFSEAKEVTFERGFLDDKLDGKHINGGETVEGWGFFEVPSTADFPWGVKDYDVAFRIEMICTDGEVFTLSLENLPQIEGIALRPVILKIGELRDASSWPLIRYSELIKKDFNHHGSS